MRTLTHTWSAIGTVNTVLVTEPAAIASAARIAERYVARLDAAASRFRPDSELSRITARARADAVTVTVSPILGGCLDAALHAARLTDGIVDPTVGRAVAAVGYDADLAEVQSRGDAPAAASYATPGADWRGVDYRARDHRLTMPRGSQIDLGATAKASAADAIAAELRDVLPGGFLVNLGGDIAVSRRPTPKAAGRSRSTTPRSHPAGRRGHRPGHRHLVDPAAHLDADVAGGATTSSTRAPGAARGRLVAGHLRRRLGLEANAASTAAIVLGAAAPAWLDARGSPPGSTPCPAAS